MNESYSMMKAQGAERICATPHFYAHREKSIEDYLQKRQAAFDSIKDSMAVQDVHLGAEIAIEHGISELPGIEKLAIEGTRIILLELPYRAYEKWMSEEIYNIAAEYRLKVMAEHTHFAFGSDAHNLTDRKPNWDLLQKKVKADALEVSDSMFERYSL